MSRTQPLSGITQIIAEVGDTIECIHTCGDAKQGRRYTVRDVIEEDDGERIYRLNSIQNSTWSLNTEYFKFITPAVQWPM